MRFSNILARALDAYAHYGATSATQALTSSGSLTATPSATGMPCESRVPVSSFLRMNDTLTRIRNVNLHERAAIAMENNVPAWSARPTGGLIITPAAPENLDSISFHVNNVAAPLETPAGSAGAAASEVGGEPASTPPARTMAATPVGYEGKGSVNPENFLPQWTVTAAPVGSSGEGTPMPEEYQDPWTTGATPVGYEGKGSVTAAPIGVEWNVPTTSITPTASPVGSTDGGSPASSCAVGADWTSGICSFSSTSTSTTTDTSAPFVPTTLSTVTVSSAETTQPPSRVSMSMEELSPNGTMADLRPGMPPVFIVVVVITVLWAAFFVWALSHVWKDDDKDEDRLKHSKWKGQEALDSQRSSDKGKSSGRADS